MTPNEEARKALQAFVDECEAVFVDTADMSPELRQIETDARAALARLTAQGDGKPIATELGPTNDWRCPECRNSLQNATPDGSPLHRRCADCKLVFRIPNASPLYQDIEFLRGCNKDLIAEVARRRARAGKKP